MGLSIGVCIAAMVIRYKVNGSPLNYGIDFTGGGIITMKVSPPVRPGEEVAATEKARTALEKAGLRVQVQFASSIVGRPRDQILIRTQLPKGESGSEAVKRQEKIVGDTLRAQFAEVETLGTDVVTPVVSKDLTRKASLAVFLGCLAIIGWIFIRYDFASSLVPKYALCAIVALFHDLIVLAGVFAIVYWVVDSPFVAAFLTVLGYSVHDTIVIFDRIRENVKLRKRPLFAELVNISLLETMARSVNTVLTVEFVLVALYLFGGVTLRSFAGALIIGITSGAWSSIFIASQLLVSWKKREEKARLAPAAARASRSAGAQIAPRRTPAPKRPSEPAVEAGAALSQTGSASAGEDSEAASHPPAGGRSGKKLRGKKRHRRF